MPDHGILDAAAKRGITRLVHFTRARYAKAIMREGEILSHYRLRSRKSSEWCPNDWMRLDGHYDYICCSIQYPNPYLLTKFIEMNEDSTWVLFFLDTSLLGLSSTKFSPVNAAKANGQYIKAGSAAFESLFGSRVPGSEFLRAGLHRRECPTDVQHEVLVKGSIPISNVTKMVVKSRSVRYDIENETRELLWRIAVSVRPELFDRDWITKRIRGSDMMIKNIDSRKNPPR